MNSYRLTLALALAAVGVSACSSQSTKSSDASTTTPSVLVAASTTSIPADVSTTVVAATQPPTTQPPATQPVATQPPATQPPTTPPGGFVLYEPIGSPTAPSNHTDPFISSGPLQDGFYWVEYSGGETMTPAIRVMQAFFGQECIDQAILAGEECFDGIFVIGDPNREFEDLAFSPNVVLTVSDAMTQQSYRITPDELRQIRASSPSDGAPEGYGFVAFPWLMTVQGGTISRFEQLWTP